MLSTGSLAEVDPQTITFPPPPPVFVFIPLISRRSHIFWLELRKPNRTPPAPPGEGRGGEGREREGGGGDQHVTHLSPVLSFFLFLPSLPENNKNGGELSLNQTSFNGPTLVLTQQSGGPATRYYPTHCAGTGNQITAEPKQYTPRRLRFQCNNTIKAQ